MTMRDKCLEMFEAYWGQRSWNLNRFDNPSGYIEFQNPETHNIWMGWKACWEATRAQAVEDEKLKQLMQFLAKEWNWDIGGEHIERYLLKRFRAHQSQQSAGEKIYD